MSRRPFDIADGRGLSGCFVENLRPASRFWQGTVSPMGALECKPCAGTGATGAFVWLKFCDETVEADATGTEAVNFGDGEPRIRSLERFEI